MGRSSAEQALHNRDRIVKGASRLFREHGVEDVSVAQVMAAVGMTPGGFYKHFESKDALVQEACGLSFDQALKSWRAVAGKEDGKADAMVEAIVGHYFKRRPLDQTCPMLAYAADVSEEDTSRATRQAYSRGAEALFELFAGQDPEANGKPDPEARENAAVVFAAMVGAQLLVRATDGSDWSKSLQANVAGRAAAISSGTRQDRRPAKPPRSRTVTVNRPERP